VLERVFTAERLNEIVNHSSIYPLVRGANTKPFDLSNIAKNTDHVCLVGEYGCVFFIKHQPGIYEFHTSVLPEGRGEWMLQGSRFAFNWMFTKTDAFELLTKCPDGNIPAKAGARAVGCSFRFRTRPIWPVNGMLVPVDVYSIILQEWAKNADNLVESGKWFHKTLDMRYTELGAKLSVHAEDEVHDRYVGAAIEMIRGEQVGKAINFYNRWASLSDYKKIGLISVEPLIIDIDDCRLNIKKDNFEVILCPQVA
jgi:hypothetical protein